MKEEFRRLDMVSSSIEDVNRKLGIISENLANNSLLNSIDFGQRTVQECPNVEERLVLTSYFTSKTDPQNDSKRALADSYEYIQPWYDSIMSLGLNGIVFHDGLSNEFIEKYSNERVQFLYCQLGDKSLNDERFILYYIFLCKNADKVKMVLMTDGNDVRIQHNPFNYMSKFHERKIFVGRNNGHRFRQSSFNMNKLIPFENSLGIRIETNFLHQTIYNAGVLGGNISPVLLQLRQMTRLLLTCKSGNNNMMVFNYVLFKYWMSNSRSVGYKYFGWLFNYRLYYHIKKIFGFEKNVEHDNRNDSVANTYFIHTSFPFCSAFKKYETSAEFIIIHK